MDYFRSNNRDPNPFVTLFGFILILIGTILLLTNSDSDSIPAIVGIILSIGGLIWCIANASLSSAEDATILDAVLPFVVILMGVLVLVFPETSSRVSATMILIIGGLVWGWSGIVKLFH